MSAFYDLASLVVVPSGYKASKVYAQKPLTTDGQLAFSRSTTATRVNSAGLIEKVRTNVALYSEQFNNANWGPTNATVTANTTTAPDGTTTADSVAFTASSSARLEGLTAGSSPAGEVTLSIYAKVASGTGSFRLRGDWSGGNSISTDFAVTTSWQRFTHTFTAASALQIMSLYNNTAGTAQTVIFWGAQAESGVATDYIATTSAAVSVGPVANVPRLDYLNSSCPRLLLEPQRTNVLQYNEQFDNAYWTKLNATITANATTSPDGYSNADQITDDATNGTHLAYRIPSGRSTGTAWSVFMKKGTLNFGFIGNVQSGTAFTTAVIDLTNGTVKELQNGSGNTGSVTVQDYGNGWYRVIMQSSANGGGTSIGTSDGSALSGATKDAIYSGTGKHIFIWGAQLEDATYATSYIPTLGAAVTRGDELATKTSASALIGQTEGTLFLEFDFVVGEQANYGIIYQAAFSTYIYVNQQVSGSIFGQIQPFGISFSVAKTSGRYKCAIAYKSGSSAFFVNGVQVGATNTTTFSPSAMDTFSFLNGDNTKGIHQALLFKTRLSNADLAALTA